MQYWLACRTSSNVVAGPCAALQTYALRQISTDLTEHNVLVVQAWFAAQEWQQIPLHNTASRSHPSGGQWKTAVIHVPGGQEHAQLEFVIKNKSGQVHTLHCLSACSCCWSGAPCCCCCWHPSLLVWSVCAYWHGALPDGQSVCVSSQPSGRKLT